MMYPSVTDHAIVQHLCKVEGMDIERAREEIGGGIEVVSNTRLALYLCGYSQERLERLRVVISDLCKLDFEPPNRMAVMVTTDRANYLVRSGYVVGCYWRSRYPKGIAKCTVLSRVTKGQDKGLGRMDAQPPPITEGELALAAWRHERSAGILCTCS